MSLLQLEFGLLSIIINVIFRIVTATLFVFFLIPLFFREARVKNGLRTLRFELLFTGTIIFCVNTFGLLIIVFRFLRWDTALIADLVTYFNSVALLAYAIAKYIIYTQKYTPENKKLHEKFEKMERIERQKAKQLTTNKKVK